jgi:hypothetical protein
MLAPLTRPAFAQGAASTGSLVGTVTNRDGDVIRGATVIANHDATGVTTETITNIAGAYAFPALQPGTYTIRVVLSGYRTAERTEVQLLAAQSRTLHIRLEPGAAGGPDTRSAVGQGDLVRSDSSVVATTLGHEIFDRLPVADRSLLNLVTFLPDVETRGGRARDSIVSGLPPHTIDVTIDGVSTSNSVGSQDGFFSLVTPRLDAMREVSLSTTTSGAESNAHGASHIRFVTRSGTSQLQTSAYESFGHAVLDGPASFDRLLGLPQPRRTTNLYGGRAGGPIVIPGLVDGRGKAFFFINHEGTSDSAEVTRTRTVLGERAMNGEFALRSIAPINVLSLAAANGQIATPDPTIRALLEQIRASRALCGERCVRTADPANRNRESFSWLVPSASRRHSPTGRLDWNVGPGQRLSATYIWQSFSNDPDTLNNSEPRFPEFTARSVSSSSRSTGSIAWRSTLSGNLVNEAHGGWQRSPIQFGDGSIDGFADQGGYHLVLGLGLTNAAPDFAVTPQRAVYSNWTINDTMHWLRGRHHVTFGASASRFSYLRDVSTSVPTVGFGVSPLSAAAAMFVGPSLTGASSAERDDAAALYALLTGRISSIRSVARLNDAGTEFVLGGHLVQRMRLDEYGFFAQDTWRWTPELTVTLGLRYELQMPMTSPSRTFTTTTMADACGISGFGDGRFGGRVCNLFARGAVNAPEAVPVVRPFNPGDRPYDLDTNNFAPAIGLSWQPRAARPWLAALLGDPELARVSGGFTRAYVRERFDRLTGSIGLNVDTSRTASGGTAPFGQPLLLRHCIGVPGGGPCGPLTFLADVSFPREVAGVAGEDLHLFDPALHTGFVDSWTVGLQRSLGSTTTVELRYAGNVYRQGWVTENWNQPNIVENGFLDEFRLAAENLRVNVAAGRGATFAYLGEGSGTFPLPIFLAHFSGRPFGDAGNPAAYTSTRFTNTTFVQALDPFAPDVYRLADELSRQPGLTSFAGLSPTFWVMNPDVDDVMVTRSQDRNNRTHSFVLDVRRRFARGFTIHASYTYSRQHAFVVPNGDLHRDALAVRVDNVPHALKALWIYEVPIGRGRRFGTGMGEWLDRAVGGWEIAGTARAHRPTFRLTNTVIEGMSFDEAQHLFGQIRVVADPATGVLQVFNMPEDVVLNTRRAFATDPSFPDFYVPGTAPTGRYFAPATCAALPIAAGDCVPDLVFNGRWFAEVDLRMAKSFPLPGRASLSFGIELYNLFNAANVVHNLDVSGGDPFRATSQASAARTGQLVWRVSW